MSQQQRLTVVEDWFKALASGMFDSIHQHHTKNVVWEVMPGPAEHHVPWAGTFRGRGGIEDCLGRYAGVVRSKGFVLDTPLVGPTDTIAVPGYSDYVAVKTGREFRIEFVEFFRFVGRKIAFVKVYGDTAAAREALSQHPTRENNP